MLVLIITGCSTKREMKFDSGLESFDNGRFVIKKEVEGHDIQEYLPQFKEEFMPYFIGWMDDDNNLVDPANISPKVKTITIKWDEEQLSKYQKEKEIKEVASLLTEAFREKNDSKDLDYEFTWEVIDDEDYIVMNTILIDQEMIGLLTNRKTRERGREMLEEIYVTLNQRTDELKKGYEDKYPMVTRFSFDNEEKTVIYEAIDGNTIIDFLKN